jgi:hypothetical protein
MEHAVRLEQIGRRIAGMRLRRARGEHMLSLLDQPQLRDRVSAISIDLSSLDPEDRGRLTQILLGADAICRLRAPQPSQKAQRCPRRAAV